MTTEKPYSHSVRIIVRDHLMNEIISMTLIEVTEEQIEQQVKALKNIFVLCENLVSVKDY